MEIIGFSVYYVEYAEHFQLPRSTVGFISTVYTASLSICGILTSTIINRYPARYVCMSGGLLFLVGHIISSFSPSVYILYVTEGFMKGMALSLALMTSSVTIQKRFVRNRTMGIGCNMLGLSLGYFIGPPLMTYLIQEYSWRGAMLIGGAISSHIVALSALFKEPMMTRTPCKNIAGNGVQNQNADEVSEPDTKNLNNGRNVRNSFFKDLCDFHVIRNGEFVLMCVSSMFGRYVTSTYMYHVYAKTVSLGIAKEDAALIMSIYGISIVCFRAMTTIVANVDGVDRLLYYGCGQLVGSVACLLTLVHTFYGLAVASVVCGLFMGMTNTIYAVVIVQLVGIGNLPKALATHNLFVCITSMTATPIGGHIYDVTENYDIPFIVASLSGLCSGICMLILVILKKMRDRHKTREEGELTP